MTDTMTISKKTQSQADRIKELMAGGKSLEEALTEVTQKTPRVTIDRLAYIKGLNNIQELRIAKKTAYAKKSKAKDKPETLAKYQAEIDLATERLNELIADVNAAEVPWMRALELGETPEGAVQYALSSIEATLDDFFKTAKGTKAQIKELTRNTPADIDFVPEQLKTAFQERLDHMDQRVQVAASKYNLMTAILEGKVKLTPPANESK